MSLKLGATDYREAATCRLEDAQRLCDKRHWVGTAYLAGRAVESMFRSLILLRGASLEIGHDLKSLLKKARSLGVLAKRDDWLDPLLSEVAGVWHNNLRYCGDVKFKRYLSDKGKNRGIKGDFAKFNAKAVLEASEAIVNRGDLIWARYKKNSQK